MTLLGFFDRRQAKFVFVFFRFFCVYIFFRDEPLGETSKQW